MGTYLDRLKTTLAESQTKQITNLIVKKKNSGEIANLEEFKSQLAALTNKLLENKISPSLELFIDKFGQSISSSSYNFMLDRIRDDLETVFTEVNNLETILAGHDNLINNIILKALKYSVNELDSKVTLYEFLAIAPEGFTNAQFNTFRGGDILSLGRATSGMLFLDPRSMDVLQQDVTVDIIGEQLLLGKDSEISIPVKFIRQVFDVASTQSEDIVSLETNDITNVIDETNGTYWLYSILQKEISKTGITAKIELELANTFDINSIEIQSASPYEMEFTEIQYIDSNNILQKIYLDDTILQGNKKIYFDKIATKKIYLVFRQLNPILTEYQDKKVTQNFTSGVLNQANVIDIESIASELEESISSSVLLNDVFNLNTIEINPINKYYNYVIGFDNIKLHYSTYSERSIFISKDLKVDNLTECSLQVKEQRPSETNGSITMQSSTLEDGLVNYFHGSLEYWIILNNFNENNELVNVKTIPILPFGVNDIYHERLVLSNKLDGSTIPNCGRLMFYTDNSNLNLIRVYKNGVLLTPDIDWEIETSLTNNEIAPSGNRNSVGIKIITPVITDFFTVSYSPLVSNSRAYPQDISNLDFDSSLLRVVDLIGDASCKIGTDNIIYSDSNQNTDSIIKYTKLNLVVILRRNSANINLSPILEEYLLLTSNKNSSKFNTL